MKKRKSLRVEHDCFLENSFVFGVFGSKRGLQANHGTVRISAISPQQAIKNELNEAGSNTAYLNKRSFMFMIKFCVFQVTTA